MKTAYAYARFSSDNQREESIDAQVRAINEYCAKEGIKLLRVFKDEAFSARTDKRPAFQELFQLIKTHPADYLIVHKSDRFARSRADDAFYRAKLKEAGMRLVSVLERFDDTPESIIMEGLMASLNEYYSANLSRESKKGIKENVLKGKRNGGKAPFGYTCVNQHLVPNKDAATVKSFFQMYAEGKKLADIAKTLKLPFVNYQAVLKNEVYLGTLISKEWRKENAHEAIIDRETWDLCQKRIKDSPFNASHKAKFPYLLSGMLECGTCGKRMVAVSCGQKYFYYSCQTKGCKRYRRDDLEERVINELQKAFVPTDAFKAKFYELVSRRVNIPTDDENAIRERLRVSQRIDKLIDSIQYTETSEDAKKIMEKVNELRRQMPPPPKKKEVVSREACDSFIESFCDLKSHDFDTMKLLLKKTVAKIVVKEDELILYTTTKTPFCIIVNKNGIKKALPEGRVY